MKVYNGPGKKSGGVDKNSIKPDMLAQKGVNGAYGGKTTTAASYGKGGYDRKGFYW